MNNYAESKAKLDAIRNKNEVLFRCAISHLMDVGIRHLMAENIEKTCAAIMQQDDKRSLMTNECSCMIIRIAGELAQIDHIHLLNYISKEVYYDVGDSAISYDRAIELLKDCINSLNYDPLNQARDIGFDDGEIETLGFGNLLEEEECEEEDEDDY